MMAVKARNHHLLAKAFFVGADACRLAHEWATLPSFYLRGEIMMKHLISAAALLGVLVAGPAFSQTSTQPSGGTPPTRMGDAPCEVVWFQTYRSARDPRTEEVASLLDSAW